MEIQASEALRRAGHEPAPSPRKSARPPQSQNQKHCASFISRHIQPVQAQMDPVFLKAESEIQRELSAGEKLLWSGQPRQGPRLNISDVFVIPFSLVWCGFAIFWETTVIKGHAPLLFKLWGVPFVVIGLYVVFGRFFVNARTRARTFYGVTNKRLIIVTGSFSRCVRSLPWELLPQAALVERGEGRRRHQLWPGTSFRPGPVWQFRRLAGLQPVALPGAGPCGPRPRSLRGNQVRPAGGTKRGTARFRGTSQLALHNRWQTAAAITPARSWPTRGRPLVHPHFHHAAPAGWPRRRRLPRVSGAMVSVWRRSSRDSRRLQSLPFLQTW